LVCQCQTCYNKYKKKNTRMVPGKNGLNCNKIKIWHLDTKETWNSLFLARCETYPHSIGTTRQILETWWCCNQNIAICAALGR
jgi:hypothetical protein